MTAGASLTAHTRLCAAQAPVLRAQRLAWAGIRLQLDSGSLFLDPLTNSKVWGGALKDEMIPVAGVSGERFVLVTHRHPDHCDPGTIRQALGEDGTLVYAATIGIPDVPGVKMRAGALYEPLLLGDFTATAVPAVDGYGDPHVSWIVTAGGRRIIHCGDTLWHGSWWRIGRQYGPFDAAFLPINGAKFGWRRPVTDVAAVMTAEQAIAAAVVIAARLVVPIHYGVIAAEGYAEDPQAEEELRVFGRRRHIDVEILKPGAWVEWHT
jgi:L-ascorbate metabolism protein UlaG (beta-lactamase superfamily)